MVSGVDCLNVVYSQFSICFSYLFFLWTYLSHPTTQPPTPPPFPTAFALFKAIKYGAETASTHHHGSLSTRVFETRTATGRGHFAT